jgi:para-nitrobenzyl esterase
MKKTIFFAVLIYSAIATAQNPIVKIENGTIEGATNSTGDIRIFKGIPFALPPVGELRWQAPKPVQNWEGTKKCTSFSASPMQASPSPFMFWSSEFLIPKEPISEDCLYLNVWTGANSEKEKLPVLVYIYGGGFRSGGSACQIYDGEAMAKKGVVFISINYRVGVFGFLAHPELSRECEYGTSGNYALLDMIEALRWVQKNVASFGGDPQNVTIAGQSAGAFGVNFLTASPLAKGLFHRAIAESGGSFYAGPLRSQMTLDNAEKQGEEFAKTLDCNSIAELRSKTAAEIQQAQGGLSSPIIDGYVIPATIYTIYSQGKQNDVPILVGWNKDDKVMGQPLEANVFHEQMTKRFGKWADAFFKVYPTSNQEESSTSQYNLSRDETFGIQDYTWAKMQTRTGKARAFIYNFNRDLPAHNPETQFGAFHSGEVVYAYNNLHTLDRPWEKVDYEIADKMSSYWANFAKNGDPNGAGLSKWTAYDPDDEQVMIIDNVFESRELPTKDQMMFWENYYLSTITDR